MYSQVGVNTREIKSLMSISTPVPKHSQWMSRYTQGSKLRNQKAVSVSISTPAATLPSE